MPAYDKSDLERRMAGAIDSLKSDLGGLRTGRASTSLLDPVMVTVYGANMPLNQVATVSVPESRMISVQVWDKQNVGPVEKAIRSAGLGLNPINDGNTLRLPIPDLTEERRKELAKLAGSYAEKAKIAVAQRPPRRHGRAQDRREEGRVRRGRAQAPRDRGPEADRRDRRRPRCGGQRQGKGNHGAVSSAPAPVFSGGTASAERPRHVAIIMDGNGRRAKQRFLPRAAGHRAGVEAVRRVSRTARALGIEALTLYAFSSENWRRPDSEIGDLMGLLRLYIRSDIAELVGDNVRLRILGDYHRFPADVVQLLDDALARTAANTGPILAIALNYGAQGELARAARRLAERAAAGELDPAAIDAEAIEAELETRELPPLDLLIRTSGEHRLSNFLLWQSAYAELLFVDTLWPDFGPDDLRAAVDSFARRQRRFGGL